MIKIDKIILFSLLIIFGFFGSQFLMAGSPVLKSWEEFETGVRDGLIDKNTARQQLPQIMAGLREFAGHYTFQENQKWVFPVKGYGLKSIGGKNGDGYQPDIVYGTSPIKGYDFFDGNRHGGHPAHDIFVRDKNQDTLDDKTAKQVELIAMTDSLVLSISQGWTPSSKLRGGNVVWLYNPRLNMIFYYAHMDKIYVKQGDFLKAGLPIGTVGRTGLLAWRKQSPTHVHLMVLKCQDNTLKPFNYYKVLENGYKKAD
ncbi:MAG: M23 family metallopeptidase [bacterium]